MRIKTGVNATQPLHKRSLKRRRASGSVVMPLFMPTTTKKIVVERKPKTWATGCAACHGLRIGMRSRRLRASAKAETTPPTANTATGASTSHLSQPCRRSHSSRPAKLTPNSGNASGQVAPKAAT